MNHQKTEGFGGEDVLFLTEECQLRAKFRYYDLTTLINDKKVQAEPVRQAVVNTFARRKTALPVLCPIGLSEVFAQDATKIAQWKGFLNKNGLAAGELSDTIASIRTFAAKMLEVMW